MLCWVCLCNGCVLQYKLIIIAHLLIRTPVNKWSIQSTFMKKVHFVAFYTFHTFNFLCSTTIGRYLSLRACIVVIVVWRRQTFVDMFYFLMLLVIYLFKYVGVCHRPPDIIVMIIEFNSTQTKENKKWFLSNWRILLRSQARIIFIVYFIDKTSPNLSNHNLLAPRVR